MGRKPEYCFLTSVQIQTSTVPLMNESLETVLCCVCAFECAPVCVCICVC